MRRALLVILLTASGSAHAQFATVRFVTDQFAVLEGQQGFTLGIQLDGPGNNGGVGVLSQDGSATAGEDYTQISELLLWQGDDSGEKFVTIETVNDGPGEGDESVTLHLMYEDGLTVGSPSSVDITISEGGGVTAAWVLPDGILPNPSGDYWVPAAGGVDIPLLLRLSEIPSTLVTGNYVVVDDPTLHTVGLNDVQ